MVLLETIEENFCSINRIPINITESKINNNNI